MDYSSTRDSLINIDKQVWEAQEALRFLKLPKNSYCNVLVLGMGGSALPAHIIQSVYKSSLCAPMQYQNGAEIPWWVDEYTLLIISSYSGTTEEMISAYKEARKRKLTPVVIASGGELAKLASRNETPLIKFSTEANQSGQPRNGLGYGLAVLIALLSKTKILCDAPSLDELSNLLARAAKRQEKNQTILRLARAVKDHAICLVSSAHLEGSLHVLQNQLHETAKQFTFYEPISELNHHLMEGLKYPRVLTKKLTAIFFASKLHDPMLQRRYPITAQVFKKQNIATETIHLSGKSYLEDALEMLMFGSFLSLELAKLNHEDPTSIPWVDWFKKQLGG